MGLTALRSLCDCVLIIDIYIIACCADTCNYSCSNTAANYPFCCDGIYLPSFVFRNVASLSQDRIQPYTIYFPHDSGNPTGGVLWEVRVHGTFYQVMLCLLHDPFLAFRSQHSCRNLARPALCSQ